MTEPAPSLGLFASLKRLLGTLLELAQVRLELALNELELQKLRLVDALIIAVASLVALGLGLIVLLAFIVSLFPEPHRPLVLGVMALLLVGGALLGLRAARERVRAAGRLFEATLDELRRDRARLDGGD